MIDQQFESPESLFSRLRATVRGISDQRIPSLRIAHDIERCDFLLEYSSGAVSLSRPDGSPVHAGIQHIAEFWTRLLKLSSSSAWIEELDAHVIPSAHPLLTMSPIYLLMTMRVIERRPSFVGWTEDQWTVARLKVTFEEGGGEVLVRPEVILEYDEELRDRREELDLLLNNTSRYWLKFCHYACPWFVDSGVTTLEMHVPIMEPDRSCFGGRLGPAEPVH